MNPLWIVTNSEGADLACNLREQAMEHAAEMAADFPQFAPWNVTEYVPAREIAAAKAHNTRLIEAINRLHEVAQGMWEGSESEIADIVNSALAWRMRREQTK